jgi:putative transposase
MKSPNSFRYFDSSPEVIRLVVMMYVRFPRSLRNAEDLLAERGIDICQALSAQNCHPLGTVKANDFSRLVSNFIMIPVDDRERIWRFSII